MESARLVQVKQLILKHLNMKHPSVEEVIAIRWVTRRLWVGSPALLPSWCLPPHNPPPPLTWGSLLQLPLKYYTWVLRLSANDGLKSLSIALVNSGSLALLHTCELAGNCCFRFSSSDNSKEWSLITFHIVLCWVISSPLCVQLSNNSKEWSLSTVLVNSSCLWAPR